MSETATKEGVNTYEGVAYNELRKIASDRTLPSNGTKEELIARLQESDATGGDIKNEGDKQEGDVPPAVSPPARVEPSSSRKVEEKFHSKAAMTKAHLAKQPKVMIFIPFEAGENPEQASKIQMVVGINGYQLNITRGTPVEVPQQIAEMVMERLASEGKAGSHHRVSGNPDKETALAE